MRSLVRPTLSACLLFCSVLLAQSPADVEAVVTTDLGTFRFEFAADKAPKHVEQFLRLARQGYYDGSAFHFAVKNGLIQGGDPLLKDAKTLRTLWGTGGLNLLPTELSDMKHERGVISGVRIPGKLNSDGAQFFVCINPQPVLDGQYSAFGRVTEGLDVAEKISQSPVDSKNLLDRPVRILKVAIENKREEPFVNASVDELRKTVTMKTTLGTLKLKMEPDWAPNHVRSFLRLASTGWYNRTSFHRVAKDFVVQGGLGSTREVGVSHYADRWVRPLKAEFRTDVNHVRGIVSMAHGDDPDSATTSFFLMLGPGENLDGKFSAFAEVVAGLEVLDAFAKEEVDGEAPKRRLEILELTVD
jgi:cyclophilin family peptidyl-prolyl cis-trans isomerase